LGERSPWLAVLFVVFCTIGALMMLVGEGADRLWGLICFAFFGVGGVGLYVPKGANGPGVAVERVERVESGDAEWCLAFPFDGRRRTVWTLAALVMGATGAVMVLFAGDLAGVDSRTSPIVLRVGGAACAVCFGGVGVLGLVRSGAPARMLLLESGVQFEGGGSRTFVPWDAIEWAGAASFNGNDVLGIRAGDPSRIEAGRVTKAFLRFNRKVSGMEASQPFSAFVAPPEVVLAAVSRFVERPEDRKLLSTGTIDISDLERASVTQRGPSRG
jgi:hypothetical protein